MPVKLQPTNVIKAHLGIESGGRIQKFFTSTCAKAMDEFVPFDRGNLAKYHIEDSNKIVYDQPYARYQYYGISKSGKPLNYNTDKHQYAGSYWDQRMWTAKGTDVVRAVQNEINRGR